MSWSDPIADMLTRIRNAARAGKTDVKIKNSNVCKGIASVLKEEGYIKDFDTIEDSKQGILRVTLKYDLSGSSVINEIKRVSKPGRRIYCSVDELPIVMSGMGISIVSTSKGIISDKNCREAKIGGELLCKVS
jgi:small subunit ribosomal protein S8